MFMYNTKTWLNN